MQRLPARLLPPWLLPPRLLPPRLLPPQQEMTPILHRQRKKWNESAFESLVLPSDPKALILALTESKI